MFLSYLILQSLPVPGIWLKGQSSPLTLWQLLEVKLGDLSPKQARAAGQPPSNTPSYG